MRPKDDVWALTPESEDRLIIEMGLCFHQLMSDLNLNSPRFRARPPASRTGTAIFFGGGL